MPYPHVPIYHLLMPFAWLYAMGVSIRNFLFDKHILHSRTFGLPVICIGNLTVGGTGKTPHTEYLIRLLGQEFQVAVLSRGYRRKSKGFVLASAQSTMESIGDEPYQMAHKFPFIYMAVDRNRCQGIEKLTDGQTAPGTRVILLDDAFQHRYVQAGLNILLIDYHRPIFKDALLPAGRLREPESGKKRAHIVIVSKCPKDMDTAEQNRWKSALHLAPTQQLYFTTLDYGKLQPLFSTKPERCLSSICPDEHILLVTGIASPVSLIETLKEYTPHVCSIAFPDHHAFTPSDLRQVQQVFGNLPEGKRLIVTTEKDAARLMGCEQISKVLAPCIYVLPITVSFLRNEQEQFNQNIIEYVRENQRNSNFHQS